MERFNYRSPNHESGAVKGRKTERGTQHSLSRKRGSHQETSRQSEKGLSNFKSTEKKKSKKRRRSYKEGLIFQDFKLKPKESGRDFMRDTSKPITIFERAA